MPQDVQDDEMKFLTSNKHYTKLNVRFDTYGNHKECETLKKEFEDYDGIYEFCLRLTGILEEIDKFKELDVYGNDPCNYLNCWIYENLLSKKLKMLDEKSELIDVKINEYWEKSKLKVLCKFDFYQIDNDKFKKMKKLYDYTLDYNFLEYYIKEYENKCNQQYYDYITESHKIYDEVNTDCMTEKDSKPYCVVLDHIHNVYDGNKLKSLTCTVTSPDQLKRLKEKLIQLEELNEEQGDTTDARQKLPTSHLGTTHAISDLPQSAESTKYHSSSGIAAAVVLPLLGIIIILFILYKFTPLRFSLYSRLLKVKIIRSIIGNDEKQELSENSYDPLDGYTHNNRHQISYHAARHS
ncbi:PIR Superfamily Protein [Plasmodium ovale wallikeri]|uniref:PIR Superfamily Protein n=2 Tax=Plasmodium ovale TaxID=36330 RepID=A0A1A8YJ03_PLAOA|nr:PIR Superfamily Protein [Plasmodium ovale wallikeri]SBT31519.1 PIR Superfamily Protein [Plasmodium ovale wallikeri]SBT75394.1 PIR protein [Plasmodium ovale]